MTTETRHYVNMHVNPCKMCMPMGASLALKGLEDTMTIIHGSQGCATYIRRHMAAHYNEPIDIASSSLSESGTVYGGAEHLKSGIQNLMTLYQPKIIAVLTSCLAETIGDDIGRIVKEMRGLGDFLDVDIIPIKTPGYGSGQSEGYFEALRSVLTYYGKDRPVSQKKQTHVNVIVSNATCTDIRLIKRIFEAFEVHAVFFPDISDVLDAPYRSDGNKTKGAGTKIKAIQSLFDACATFELGDLTTERSSPGVYLQDQFQIPLYRLPLPIGMTYTDQLVEALKAVTGKLMPKALVDAKGRLLDGMIDAHKHMGLGEVAVFGDLDLVKGIASLLMENGAKVKVAATGTLNQAFREDLERMHGRYQTTGAVLQDVDFETIQKVVCESHVNLMIGTSEGKFIKEHTGIPLIRVGFPVHDHVGAQRKPLMGYEGSLQFLDDITNHLLDIKHEAYHERMYATYYPAINEGGLPR